MSDEAPSTAGRRLVSTGLWALLGQALTLAASLICTPFVIRGLGPDAYGLLALVTLIVTYLTFADVGMGNASTKFASSAHAAGSDEREASVVWTALVIALVPSGVAALAVSLAAGPLTAFFNVPQELVPATRVGIVVACIAFVLRSAIGVLNTPQLVRLRLDLYTGIITAASLAQIVGVPVALAMGGGLEHAFLVTMLATGANLVATAVVSARLLPRLVRPSFSRELVRPLLSFGGGMLAAWVIALVLVNVEKLLVARNISSASLAYYTVAHTLASIAATAPRAMSASLLPAFTRFRDRGDPAELQRLYGNYQKVTVLWMMPVAAGMTTFARPFLDLWAGPEYGLNSTPLFWVILLGTTAQLLGQAPREVLKAAGRPDLLAKCIAHQLVPHLVIAWLLIEHFGLMGAAIAWTGRTLIDVAAFAWLARKHCGVSFAATPGGRPAFLAMAALLGVTPILSAVAPPSTLVGWALLGVGCVLALVVYTAWVFRGVLDEDQRTRVMQLVRRVLRVRDPTPG